MRPRRKNRDLPVNMYIKSNTYYLVKFVEGKRKWVGLGKNRREAFMRYANMTDTQVELMPALIDKASWHILEGRAKNTQKGYTVALKDLKEIFKDFVPQEVTHVHVVQMLDMYKGHEGVGNMRLVVLKLVFQYALDRGLVEHNPCASVKRLKTQARKRVLSLEEFQAIYDKVNENIKPILMTCLLTGQRIGDVVRLKAENLLDEGILFTQQKTGKRLIIGWTKTLKEVIQQCKPDKGWVFKGAKGTHRSRSSVYDQLKTAAGELGIVDVCIHDIRSLAAILTDKQGLDASSLLGHSTKALTEKHYLRNANVKITQALDLEL